ncbi:odorant receptor, putative [Pediculus humanus corporis]|uniref:Odorant receptor, putative n=1 Tax=Pediculus humanus subsp. corporis TaxID=121224 RepID=E0VN34_PEDHC|nr:odorant receptor, putative [Pediculus humanus corporis]EEB14800.1 odorant receptor, putative [Pediculus humanus corporis]
MPMCLYITLPPEFPNEKPSIRVQPPVKHGWVSNNTDIDKAPGLLNFTAHSDLGRVVQVIIREFQIRPPMVVGCFSNSIGKFILPRNYNFVSSFPELISLSNEELQLLNSNPDKLDDFVSSLKPCIDFNKLIESRFQDVETLAKNNLSKQGKLENVKKQIFSQMEQAKELKKSFEIKSKEFENLSQKYQPLNICHVLRLEAINSDEESEIIAEKFLNKEIDIEKFLLEYVEKRKISHIRKTKEEKLSNQLKELQRANY